MISLLTVPACTRKKPFRILRRHPYSKMMDENVKSTIFLTKAVLSLLSDDSPSILNIASDAALEGNYGCAVYAASKGAVVAFTRSAALDLFALGSALTASAPVMSIRPL